MVLGLDGSTMESDPTVFGGILLQKQNIEKAKVE
jgi:hypothetical protein